MRGPSPGKSATISGQHLRIARSVLWAGVVVAFVLLSLAAAGYA